MFEALRDLLSTKDVVSIQVMKVDKERLSISFTLRKIEDSKQAFAPIIAIGTPEDIQADIRTILLESMSKPVVTSGVTTTETIAEVETPSKRTKDTLTKTDPPKEKVLTPIERTLANAAKMITDSPGVTGLNAAIGFLQKKQTTSKSWKDGIKDTLYAYQVEAMKLNEEGSTPESLTLSPITPNLKALKTIENVGEPDEDPEEIIDDNPPFADADPDDIVDDDEKDDFEQLLEAESEGNNPEEIDPFA